MFMRSKSKVLTVVFLIIGLFRVCDHLPAWSAVEVQSYTEIIRVENIRATDITRKIGLCDIEDLKSLISGWRADNYKSGVVGLLPDGIDAIVPDLINNSLVVHGTREGISKLKGSIVKIDVPPIQIMMFMDDFEINKKDLDTLGIWSLPRGNIAFVMPCIATLTTKQLRDLRPQFTRLFPPTLIDHPFPVTMDGIPCKINMKHGDISLELTMTPQLNQIDKSITLCIQSPDLDANDMLYRVNVGEWLAIYKPSANDRKGILLLILPSVRERPVKNIAPK